jgi:hypothetical protein
MRGMDTTRVPAPPELNTGILPGNAHLDDWIMLALAVLSAGLLGYLVLNPPDHDVALDMFYADCVLCTIFLVSFVVRWRRHDWSWAFLSRNWYEALALLPVVHPAMLPHRFVIVLVLLARIGRACDRALGEQFFYRLVDRLADAIVERLKRPITLAVMDEVVKVLETGNYPENLAKSLNANQTELRTIISEKIAHDRQLGRLSRVPYSGEIVASVVDTVFRVVLDVLRDPRIDDFFASVVRDNREQIREAVALGMNDRPSIESEEALLPSRTQRAAIREYDQQHHAQALAEKDARHRANLRAAELRSNDPFAGG